MNTVLKRFLSVVTLVATIGALIISPTQAQTAPAVSVHNTLRQTFSPANGEDTRVEFLVLQESEVKAQISDARGSKIRDLELFNPPIEQPASKFTNSLTSPEQVLTTIWDGKDSSGDAQPNGDYLIEFTATNPATSESTTLASPVRINGSNSAAAPSVSINGLSATEFDPNAGQRIELKFEVNKDVDAEVRVEQNNSTFFSQGGISATKGANSFIWDGKNANGTIATDGNYTFVINVIDRQSQRASDSTNFAVQSTNQNVAPKLTNLSSTKNPFRPEIDTTTEFSFSTDQSISFDYSITGANGIGEVFSRRNIQAASGNVTFSWDGKNSAGNLVPKGDYTLEVIATNNTNQTSTIALAFDVERAAPTDPTVAVAVSQATFNPKGTAQEVSVDANHPGEFKYEITDANNNLYKDGTITFNNAGIQRFTWNGKNEKNNNADSPNGTYKVSGTFTSSLNNKQVSDSASFTLDDQSGPAGDPQITNVKTDPNPFDPKINQRAVTSFTVNKDLTIKTEILDSANKEVSSSTFNVSKGDQSVTWDGRLQNGQVAAEGQYKIRITATDNNNKSATFTATIEVKYTPAPTISGISVTENPFDTRTKAKTEFKFTLSADGKAVITIQGKDGNTIRTLNKDVKKGDKNNIEWDGKDSSGKTVADGTYTYKITVTDDQGRADSKTGTITVKQSKPLSEPTISALTVAPNPFDPRNRQTEVSFQIDQDAEITATVTGGIVNKTIYNNKTAKSGNIKFQWDGRHSDNSPVADGRYTVTIVARNQENRSTSATARIEVKKDATSASPTITNVKVAPNPFDPATQSRATINFDLNKAVTGDFELKNSQNQIIASTTNSSFSKGSTSINWDGRNTSNSIVDNGIYTFTITVKDSDNRTDRATGTIEVRRSDVTAGPRLTNVNTQPSTFDPARTSTNINFTTNVPTKVTIDVIQGSNSIIRRLASRRDFAAGNNSLNWDGRYNSGQFVPNGTYNVSITATDSQGRRATSTTSVTVNRNNGGGNSNSEITSFNVSPSSFDPNRNERATINYTIRTNGNIANVRTEIYDGSRRINTVDSHRAQSRSYSIFWDGRDDSRRIVRHGLYTVRTTLTDDRGTNIVRTGTIRVSSFIVGPGTIAPNITNVSASPRVFDPEKRETTRIEYRLNTRATVTVEIFDGNNLVETLRNRSSQAAGYHTVTWDGRDDANRNVRDRRYEYRIYAYNSEGSDRETGTVEVDSNNRNNRYYPEIEDLRASPRTFEAGRETTRISYRLTEDADVTVRIYDRNDRLIETLVNDRSQNRGSNSVRWNGEDRYNDDVRDGTYTVEVRAENRHGTDTEKLDIYVDEDNRRKDDNRPVISQVTVDPYRFDPRSESTKIEYHIDENAHVTVEILSRFERTPLRTIISSQYQTAGDHSVRWDGEDRYGREVAENTYRYIITARNSEGTDHHNGTVVVDEDADNRGNRGRYGSLRITSDNVTPSRFDPNKESAVIQYYIDESADVTVEILDGSRVIRTLTDNDDLRRGRHSIRWNGEDRYGREVNEGRYRYRIEARNRNGRDTAEGTIRVDYNARRGSNNNNDYYNCSEFEDVHSGGELCRSIKFGVDRGIFNRNDLFRPNSPIKRSEVTKFILEGFGINIMSSDGTNLGFTDLNGNQRKWYMPYIRTAQKLGIINGYPDGTFRPENGMSRAELLKVFLRSSGVPIPTCNKEPYADTPIDSATTWYIDYVCYSKDYDLMNGTRYGRFNPGEEISRGDVARLFYRFNLRGKYEKGLLEKR